MEDQHIEINEVLLISTVGSDLKKLRLKRNMAREKVAELAGVALTALKNLENGKGATLRTLVRVLAVLDRTEWLSGICPDKHSAVERVRASKRRQTKLQTGKD